MNGETAAWLTLSAAGFGIVLRRRFPPGSMRLEYFYRHRRTTSRVGRAGCALLAFHDVRLERRLARSRDRWAAHDVEGENGRETANGGDW